MIRTPAYYQRRARRRLMRLAFYSVLGSFAAGITYVTANLYLPIFL